MKKTILLATLIAFAVSTNAQEKYAILICGESPSEQPVLVTEGAGWGSPGDYSWNEFWNDTFLMWEMLVYEKGYDDNNVYVLYYDGNDYFNINQDARYIVNPPYLQITDHSASKANVEMVFNGLAAGTGDFPQVTEDDFLFVWTFGHGLGGCGEIEFFPCLILYSDEIMDFEFANLVNAIPANKKTFWMQQCFGGSFVDNLESTTTVFHSAGAASGTPEERKASVADDNWDIENEFIGSEKYQHGEFNFHMYSSIVGQNPIYEDSYGTELFTVADINSDNYISIYETWLWEQSHETRPEIPHYSDLGNIGSFTSLEYPTLLHQNITTTETYRGLIGISKEIHITAGNQLIIKENAKVVILNNANLIVDAGATLIIEDNVTMSGNTTNKIIVDGDIQIGTSVVFERFGETGYFSGINFMNPTAQIDMNTVTFNYAKFNNYSAGLTITNSIFNECDLVQSYNANVSVLGSYFYATWLYLESSRETEDVQATIRDCNFTNDDETIAAIHLWNYYRFVITNNTIDGYYVGLQLMQSGYGTSGKQGVFNNEIKNCDYAINAYTTVSTISNNNIHDNVFGVRLSNNCNTNLSGNPDAGSYAETQQIMDNDSYELYATVASFPWYMRHNVIIDEDNFGNPDDPLVYYQHDFGFPPTLDVRYNCWGNNFIVSEDLYPGGYLTEPTWCPGGGPIQEGAVETLYLSGKEQFDNEEYVSAKSTFEVLIDQYPETRYASAAMKDLFSLEKYVTNDYNSLKQYFVTTSNIQSDTILGKLSAFLANRCEIELENWQIAIDHYEDIILNPETIEDSIFAIIDLGHTYNLMDNSGDRSMAIGNMMEHKPNSREEFFEKRDFLLAMLPIKISNNNSERSDLSNANELLQNIPNPFSDKTNISFNLNVNGEVIIRVVNQTGKTVKELKFIKPAGKHEVELDMGGLPNGIYYYSLLINNKRVDTKKMIVIK